MLNKFLKHLNHFHKIIFIFSCFIIHSLVSMQSTDQKRYAISHKEDNTYLVTIFFPLKKKDFIYHDFFNFSVSHPDATMSPWETNKLPSLQYDSVFKDTKHIYHQSFYLSIKITILPGDVPVFLYCSYYQHSKKSNAKGNSYLLSA